MKYWGEGNTNQAARNIYNILLNKKKLIRIKAIIQIHYDIYKNDFDGFVDWLDNTVIKPNGYRIDHVVNKNKEALKQWDYDAKMISDKNHMLNASSFESIILFLMQKDNKYLKQLEGEYKTMQIKLEKLKKLMAQNGGSTTLQIAEDFLKINCDNVGMTKKILQKFDKVLYNGKKGKYDGKNIVEDLAENMCNYFTHIPDIKDQLMYSSRTRVYDIWYIVMFLLSLQSDILHKYFLHIKEEFKKKLKQERKMRITMKKLKRESKKST